jgi:hypothetical protein
VLARLWTGWRTVRVIVKPETVIAWHRQGFRLWWTWKSRRRLGRPTVPADVRALIRTMSQANPRWGAPRIHGELLKLGLDVCETTVAKYMTRPRQPPSQTWRTFLRPNCGGRFLHATPSGSSGAKTSSESTRRTSPHLRNRLVFRELMFIVKQNERLQSESGYFLSWAGRCYGRDQALAIRREVDESNDAINLVQLMSLMIRRPKVMSRARYKSAFPA